MDITAQWSSQGNGVVIKPAVEKSVTRGKVRPEKEKALNCPRCNSINTKFCYYNNYSLSQPRYFCKTCRRYWTQGGTLRNVPVGGSSRKARKSPYSSCSEISSRKAIPEADAIPPKFSSQNPKIYQGKDLNLGYDPSVPIFNGSGRSGIVADLPFDVGMKNCNPKNPNCASSFPILDFKASLGFVEGDHQNTALLSPLEEELKTVSRSDLEEGGDQMIINGYWNQAGWEYDLIN